MPRKRRRSKQEDKRLDHKAERAAVRQVLDGGKHRQPRGTSWAHSPDPTPVLDKPDDR